MKSLAHHLLATAGGRLAAAGLGVLLFSAGCAGYHAGSLMHPQIHSVAVDPIRNTLEEPRLGVLFRERLLAGLMNDGSVRLARKGKADAVISGRIVRVAFGQVARSKTRAKDARVHDWNAYQTTVYRATVAVALTVTVPGRRRPLIPEQTIVGQADFPVLSDLRIARRDALRQALADAARKAVAAVTEAW